MSSVKAAISATEKGNKDAQPLKTDMSLYRCNQVEIVRPVHTFLLLFIVPIYGTGLHSVASSEYIMIQIIIDFHLYLIIFRLN